MSVQVLFPDPYKYQPKVTVLPDAGFSGKVWVENIDSIGFRLRLESASDQDRIFHWCAL